MGRLSRLTLCPTKRHAPYLHSTCNSGNHFLIRTRPQQVSSPLWQRSSVLLVRAFLLAQWHRTLADVGGGGAIEPGVASHRVTSTSACATTTSKAEQKFRLMTSALEDGRELRPDHCAARVCVTWYLQASPFARGTPRQTLGSAQGRASLTIQST
jgi:hypothetical protein